MVDLPAAADLQKNHLDYPPTIATYKYLVYYLVMSCQSIKGINLEQGIVRIRWKVT